MIFLAAVFPFVASLAWMKERTGRAVVPTSVIGQNGPSVPQRSKKEKSQPLYGSSGARVVQFGASWLLACVMSGGRAYA